MKNFTRYFSSCLLSALILILCISIFSHTSNEIILFLIYFVFFNKLLETNFNKTNIPYTIDRVHLN